MKWRELWNQAFAYAKLGKGELGRDDAVPFALVVHYLFPNLNEIERDFLTDLWRSHVFYDTWVNNYVYEGDRKKEEAITAEEERKFLDLKKNPLLSHIKGIVTPVQLEIIAKIENVEILPPPGEKK